MRGIWSMAVAIALLQSVGAVAKSGPDQAVGTRHQVRIADLPPPGATPSSVNPPERVERRPGDVLRVPKGFAVNAFAEGLDHPRWMGLAPNGDVFLAETFADKVTVLRDADGDGIAESRTTYAGGFNRPHGIAFVSGAVLVADLDGLWRFEYAPGERKGARRKRLTAPGAFGTPGGHWSRNIAVAPDGKSVYVAIGSRGNIGEEPEPRATVQRFALDGTAQATFASGLRNAVGIAFYPGTNDLYVVVNERDGHGDGMVPDYLTRIRKGEFFGWPYAWLGPNPEPRLRGKRPDLVKRTKVPDLLFQAHSAPVGLVFYDAKQFPASYRGDAFVALRGSWNSSTPTGYKVVRVKFADRRPVGWYQNFAVGFWKTGTDKAQVWGRPAGLLVAADGSLLIADDTGKAVWRVSFRGK